MKLTRNIQFRKAEWGDRRSVFLWRNDRLTRLASFNTKRIPWAVHLEWFKEQIKSPDSKIWIIFSNRRKAGVIRFVDKKNGAEVSIFLKPSERGKGLGKEALSKACRVALKQYRYKRITAKIKKQNSASARAFSEAGFKLTKKPSIITGYYAQRSI